MMTMFESELPGIFAWMVKGCLAWQQEGLGMPPDVAQAIGNYRREMDILSDFLDEYCLIDKKATITKKDLYLKYQTWAQENGEREFSKKLIGTMLIERGFDEGIQTNIRIWKGIGAKP